MWLICAFLCGQAGKGKGIRLRYAPISNLIRLSVRFDLVLSTLSIPLALIFSCDLSSNKDALLCFYVTNRHEQGVVTLTHSHKTAKIKKIYNAY